MWADWITRTTSLKSLTHAVCFPNHVMLDRTSACTSSLSLNWKTKSPILLCTARIFSWQLIVKLNILFYFLLQDMRGRGAGLSHSLTVQWLNMQSLTHWVPALFTPVFSRCPADHVLRFHYCLRHICWKNKGSHAQLLVCHAAVLFYQQLNKNVSITNVIAISAVEISRTIATWLLFPEHTKLTFFLNASSSFHFLNTTSGYAVKTGTRPLTLWELWGM